MKDWTTDAEAALGWMRLGAQGLAGLPYEILHATDGAPAFVMRLTHPTGPTFTVSATLRGRVLRYDLMGAAAVAPAARDWPRILQTHSEPVLARLFVSQDGGMLDLVMGIPVLTPEDSVDVARGFGMICDAAAQVVVGGVPRHMQPVEITSKQMEIASVALKDSSLGTGTDAQGIASTLGGRVVGLSLASRPGALLIQATAGWWDATKSAALDQAIRLMNLAAPTGAVARDANGTVRASVSLMPRLTSLGPLSVAWAARQAMELVDAVADHSGH